MNIAVDSTAILAPMSRNRGIGNYALSQFKTMMEKDENNNYFFLNMFDEQFSFNSGNHTYNNLHEFYFWCGKDMFLSTNTDYIDIYAGLIRNYIKEHNIDVFYITSPFDNCIFPYKREWFGDIPVIATVYDIIPCVMKDIYLADEAAQKWYMSHFEAIKHFDKYLVISDCTKDDLAKHAGIEKHRIDVMHGAADKFFRKINISEIEKNSLINKFAIDDKFILSITGDDYRKNIKELIIAYSMLPTYLIKEYQLVIVAKLTPQAVEHYSNIINEYNLKGRVILTNFVTNEELLHLYNLAQLMAFPSKYEGFGLPVAEAFTCGTPVLTSNNSSLGEIAQDAAVLVDPFSIEDISKGLEHALTDADTKAHVRNGYEKLKLYKWDKVAEIAINTINSLNTSIVKPQKNKKKIAFFTPLPPMESGISDYSVDILNALSSYCDIDVYIDDEYTPVCDLNSNISIFNHKQYTKKVSTYYDTIYQVGNSVFHVYMFRYIKQYEGIVVLHDYNLHGVTYHDIMHICKSNDEYKRRLLEDYSPDQTDAIVASTQTRPVHELVYDVEINGFVTNYASKIIVHSDEAREKLLIKNIGRNVRTIRSYAVIEPISDNSNIRNKYGYSTDNVIFASFGHIHEIKRTIPSLKAFNRLVQKNANATYVFVGKLAPSIEDEFDCFIKANNLEDKVKVTGYADLSVFKDYIDIADICINLRYPYNGETSGSLMRILAKGKCVVVNDIGSFSEIPDDCCIKIPNAASLSEDSEVDHIYNAMKLLTTNPTVRTDISKAARWYAENNLDLDVIAKQYYEFICEDTYTVLSEKTLENIVGRELLPKEYSDEEIEALSRTLAYAKVITSY